MMFSHTTIRFSYGPRGPGFGKLASIISARSVMLQSVGLEKGANFKLRHYRLIAEIVMAWFIPYYWRAGRAKP